MPPRRKVTREEIVQAAVEVARRSGVGSVNARAVAAQLHCSTQPVMYHFATIDALKRAAYARVDRLHTQYLMNASPGRDPLLGIGLNYIRFAVEEPHLFRFLFQSGYAQGKSLADMIDSDELNPVLDAMQEGLGMDRERTKAVFLTVALFTHGYASLIANNALEFDEALVSAHLERAFYGAVLAAAKEEEK